MLYIKSYAFIKRTCLLLSPLFLVTLASKELAFYSPAATLSPMLGDSDEAKDSIITLASHLHQDLPDEIEDYGNLKIQKNWFGDLWIEETNSLSTFSHNTDYKFKEAKGIVKEGEKSNIYVLKEEVFEAVKDKGDINVLITFELRTEHSEPIQITHIVPLVDLTTSTTKEYTVVSTKFDKEIKKHQLSVKKDELKQQITFQLDSEIKPTSFWLGRTNTRLTINSFYFLFNDNPPLNPKAYFTNFVASADLVGDISNGRVKKVFLNKWSNSKKQTEPTYIFDTSNDFWKSSCSDPYRVGGFIDDDLNQKAEEKKKQEVQTKKQIDDTEKTKLKKQKKSYVEFRANKKEVQTRTGQYFWKTIKDVNAYVPHDEYLDENNKICEKLDAETKTKLQTHLNSDLNRELNHEIKKELIPIALSKELGINKENQTTSEYPKQKIVQSSFRAWGNAYLTKQGENVKDGGKYSKQFELTNQTKHTFSIKINKDTWKKHLTENTLYTDKINNKPLNQSQDISSLIEVYYPISFSFFDPISSYLRKHSLLLKTELDLSQLYEHSSYSKEVFRFDIGRNNKEIGKDYQGFPISNKNKEKSYGLDGVLSFISELELDRNKNLNIHLTAQTNGFVNTKNPSCDLRHRVYKIQKLNGNWETLKNHWKCSTEPNWIYRKHIHIPSYLELSLDREPEVSSFYIDRQSEVTEKSQEATESQTTKPIRTLSELSTGLEAKEIVKVISSDESNKAEVYFRDIETYGKHDNDTGSFYDTSNWYNSKQNLYYWHPRRAYGKIDDIDFENLKSITLKLDGSKNSYSAFFHSNHFNTLTTLCLNNKYAIPSSSSSDNKECGDGNKYEKEEKDTTSSKLPDLWGTQELVIDFSQNKLDAKSEEKDAEEVKFRVTYNRANLKEKDKPDNNSYEQIKEKLQNFFKGEETTEPKAAEIPDVSMLAFWYSIFLWKKDNKLHYATQIRPIGLITQEIKNSNAEYARGAAGSAGFEISKFEFRYTTQS